MTRNVLQTSSSAGIKGKKVKMWHSDIVSSKTCWKSAKYPFKYAMQSSSLCNQRDAGGGSVGRIKAVWLLSSHLSQHDWSSKGNAQWERLAQVHAGAHCQNLGQRACLLFCIFGNIHYASNLPLRSLRVCPFKCRRRDMSEMWEEPNMLSQLYNHTVINTEVLEVWTSVVCH